MIVHSYARFSDPSQEAGDSLRRQREAAVEFCKRKGWTLSDLTFTDKGRSGYKGDKQRALNAFLKAVDNGKVSPGETLLVEAVDRLSRKGVRQTQNLVNKLFDAGINVAILSPVEKVYRANDSNDIGGAIELAAFAYQGYVYSENLSNRVKSFNENQRKRVRNGSEKSLKTVLPSWLEKDSNGKVKPKPDAVKAIKFIFKRTIEGVGRKKLGQELNAKFKPLSTRKNVNSWNEPMIANIIKTRRVLGEVVSTVTGESFKDYYPKVIDEKTWLKANVEANKRRTEKGPPTERVNLFNGILWHAVDGCKMGFHAYANKLVDGTYKKYRRYKSYDRTAGVKGSSPETIDVDRFEDLIFEFLPRLELKKKQDNPRAELTATRDYLESEITALQNQITSRAGSAAVLAGPLADLSEQLDKVKAELKITSENPTVPPSKKYREKLARMRRGTVEERLLVRDGIRDIVSRIDVYPIKLGPKRSDRVKTIVEIQFKTGEFVRAVELEHGKLVSVRGSKNQQPLAEQCKDGFRYTVDMLHELQKLA